MKKNIILKLGLLIMVVVQLLMIYLVFLELGSERIVKQSVRLFIHIAIFALLIDKERKASIFPRIILSIYYLFMLGSVISSLEVGWSQSLLITYYCILITIINFDEWIERKLHLLVMRVSNNKTFQNQPVDTD
ncbi:hypothetical protein [Flammeovirga sp. EKP202]|uniref:hypothetical protein n=1 Tax=Flammeovirga sp. EKP202 TaxID=2770592 RepID=UPI00165F6559|nr:hypothetical protein [Flammeovirga sp. EKP202]MBD0403026.1 hypothetical protein [Flammeovirga sp. EKP202]